MRINVKKPPAEPEDLEELLDTADSEPATAAQEWRQNPYTQKVQLELRKQVGVKLKQLYMHCRDSSIDAPSRGLAAEITALETFSIMCGGVPITRITDKERK